MAYLFMKHLLKELKYDSDVAIILQTMLPAILKSNETSLYFISMAT